MTELTIHCDGSCYWKDCHMGLGIAWFREDDVLPFHQKSINKHEQLGTSNEAEYLAIINALHAIGKTQPWLQHHITICSDSQVVISQIKGEYRITNPRLQDLYTTVMNYCGQFPVDILFQWVPRTNPRQQIVDKLSKDGNQYFINKKK